MEWTAKKPSIELVLNIMQNSLKSYVFFTVINSLFQPECIHIYIPFLNTFYIHKMFHYDLLDGAVSYVNNIGIFLIFNCYSSCKDLFNS